VQIVYSSHRGPRDIEHLGSAHSGAEVELLKAAARQRLAAGQGEPDLGLAVGVPGAPLPITSSRMAHLWDALAHAYRALGFDGASGGDEVFRQLVLARIIEPTSKLDSAQVLEETEISAPSYPDAAAAPAHLCQGLVAAEAGRRVRRACGAGPGQPGALRRVHSVFRVRCRGWVPRARILQGAAPGPADHHRPARRPDGIPAEDLVHDTFAPP
jgi:hypothetical protein